MKSNQLATLVLRLLGIYCLIVFVPFVTVFSSALYYARSNSNYGTLMVALAALFCLLWLAVGVSLIAFSVSLGNKLTAGFAESNVTNLPFEQLQALAFAVAGALIFAESLPQLFSSISSLFAVLDQLAHKDQYPVGLRFNLWPTLLGAVGTFLKAGLGLWLFFGARGVALLWRSMRNFGTPKPPEN
jgi:hypothetical protein